MPARSSWSASRRSASRTSDMDAPVASESRPEWPRARSPDKHPRRPPAGLRSRRSAAQGSSGSGRVMPNACRIGSQERSDGRRFPVSIKDKLPTETWACSATCSRVQLRALRRRRVALLRWARHQPRSLPNLRRGKRRSPPSNPSSLASFGHQGSSCPSSWRR
jgi:hypothetical protein